MYLQEQDYKKSVEVVTLDIVKDKSSMTQVDAAAYKSDKAKRGPLDKQEWRLVELATDSLIVGFHS